MITILYVDDEPALLDIARRFLEKNSEFKVYTAETAREGLDIVKNNPPQAIVSDYQMPEMDGMAFLKEIRMTSQIPFIMFTGRGSEMVAMEATNNGADYYIQKGADPRALFAELTYKLRLAVSDRKTETEEQRMKKTIRTLIDKTYGAVIIHSPEGRIFDVNGKMLELFHLTREEALKMTISDLSGPDSPDQKRTEIINTVLSGEDQFLIWEARRPHDNSIVKVEKFLTRINFGKTIYILCNMRDISLKEKAIEIEAAIQYAVNHTSEGIICCDRDSRILYINSTWTDRLNTPSSDIIGQFLSKLDPTLTIVTWKEHTERCQDEGRYVTTSAHHDKNGDTIPITISWNHYSVNEQRFFCLYIRETIL